MLNAKVKSIKLNQPEILCQLNSNITNKDFRFGTIYICLDFLN